MEYSYLIFNIAHVNIYIHYLKEKEGKQPFWVYVVFHLGLKTLYFTLKGNTRTSGQDGAVDECFCLTTFKILSLS